MFMSRYSTSVVESERMLYNFDLQLIAVPLILKRYPKVLLLLSKSLARSASQKPFSTTCPFLKHKPIYVIFFRYMNIHLTVFQCSMPRSNINLLTTPTIWAMCGLVEA